MPNQTRCSNQHEERKSIQLVFDHINGGEARPVEIETSNETFIIATDGLEYLDSFNDISVVNNEDGHPKIIAAVKAQIEQTIHCYTYFYYNNHAGR